MPHNELINENQLDEWVRSNAQRAQGTVVELVYRLVAAASPNPIDRRFPLGDSIGQHGPDGFLNTEFNYDPFIPEGKSYWEIGSGLDARSKASSDYRDLVKVIDCEERLQSTFIFVTPLSARRDWEYTWDDGGQLDWVKRRLKRKDWKDVRVIDGTKLIDWLHHFPAVKFWLANELGLPVNQIETLDQRWDVLRTIGDPPPLIPNVFLVNRAEACKKLEEIFEGKSLQLKLGTHFPDQVTDFVSAYVANMEYERKFDFLGNCLIISSVDAWDTITALRERQILIADFNLENRGAYGAKLLEKARRKGHAVIYSGQPEGIPYPHHVYVPNPTKYQIQETLVKAGYKEERARILALKSNGNISDLLKILQNLSLIPEWAQKTDAADLAIAELLGSWNENTKADLAVVEELSGNSYGEWIRKIRDIAFQPGPPLNQREGVWKFVARYEGWYSLGPKISDENLDTLRQIATNVLRERDPKFELPPDERFAANVHGKILKNSSVLREGLVESLALLGSHPGALTYCSIGKAEDTAVLAVREILSDADWVLWASLNNQLHLLAEAAPREFLNAVENALTSDPCPFDTLFAQEGSGMGGTTYISGLLWALETLAWSPDYLFNVISLLGELAARDPGGNYTNRPANSLTTILLPWLPQTCSPISQRKIAIETLIVDQKDVAWNLLLSLLPQRHQTSGGSCKPIWRELIPNDWSKGVTRGEYWEQVAIYTDLTISMAKNDIEKLLDLFDHFNHLPLSVQDQLFDHINSSDILSLPETEKYPLWDKLVNLAIEHRKFADSNWAMKPEQLDKLNDAIKYLEPKSLVLRHRRLFSEISFELFEECGNYEEQYKQLENARYQAVCEISKAEGIEAIFELANNVDAPWYVGIEYGKIVTKDADLVILPKLLESDNGSLKIFAGGFIRGRFQEKGWLWVDRINLKNWSSSQVGQFLAYLPFTSKTWDLVTIHLQEDENPYWSRANPALNEETKNIEYGINQLIEHNRPMVAIRCLGGMKHFKQSYSSEIAIRALNAAVNSNENIGSMDNYVLRKLIESLQNNSNVKQDDLLRIEWMYLPLFYYSKDVSPKTLEQQLAEKPEFFCEIIRILYRSKKAGELKENPEIDNKNLATNAYHLFQMWKIPPGCQQSGKYDGDALLEWLDAVKKECIETGHYDVAMITVGQVLIHTPPDPDGLWIHHSAAKVLNAKDAKKMRKGFRTAFFNSRGVHISTSGEEELALAEKYRKMGNEVESYGYHRLADSLRDLASSYVREAELEANERFLED